MIVKEYYTDEDTEVKYCKTYSDSNHYIQKIGTDEKYQVAVDIEDSEFEYIELDETFEDSTAEG